MASGLSAFLPPNSYYFYAFPKGESSGFYNQVPNWIEKLVAGRTLLVSGRHVHPVLYPSNIHPKALALFRERGLYDENRHASPILLSPPACEPESIGLSEAEINGLVQQTRERSLLIAQPILSEKLKNRYLIEPGLTHRLNDKRNLRMIFSERWLARRLIEFTDGSAFALWSGQSDVDAFVVKITSSSAGDGIRICQNRDDLKLAQRAFAPTKMPIIVEEFVPNQASICVQVGVPFASNLAAEILGANMQLVDAMGGFVSGVVDTEDLDLTRRFPELKKFYRDLQNEVLPRIRSQGWFGVGGIDVLIGERNEIRVIDANFRLTSTYSLVELARQGRFMGRAATFASRKFNSEEVGHSFSTNPQLLPLSLTIEPDAVGIFGAVVARQARDLEFAQRTLSAVGFSIDDRFWNCVYKILRQ